MNPGKTVTFVYKFNVYMDELRWNMATADTTTTPGVTRRSLFEIQTETGLAATGATMETIQSGIALPGLLFQKYQAKWKYRWAFANRPSITGSNLASGITRNSFGNTMRGWLARKDNNIGFVAPYTYLDGDTITEQSARNEANTRSVNINFDAAADGTRFVPDVQ